MKFRLCLPRSLEAHPAPPNRLLVVMGAAAAGGLRWALTQLLLTSIGEGVNSHGADIETKARVALLEADEGALRNDGAARGAATHRLSRSLRRDLGDTSVPPPPSPSGGLKALLLVYRISPASFATLVPPAILIELPRLRASRLAVDPSLMAEAAGFTVRGRHPPLLRSRHA